MSVKKPKCDYRAKDGPAIYEQDKARHRRLTGPKSRLGWGYTDLDNWDEIDWSKKGDKNGGS